MPRKALPKSVRVAVWTTHCGDVYNHKCFIHYCPRIMTAHDYESGHIVSHANGGSDRLSNLLPICSTCNKSMGTMSIPDYNNILAVSGDTPIGVKNEIQNYMHSNQPESSVDPKPKKGESYILQYIKNKISRNRC